MRRFLPKKSADHREQIKVIDFHFNKRKDVKKYSITSLLIDPGTKNVGLRCVKETRVGDNSNKEILFFDVMNPGKKNDSLFECMSNTIDMLMIIKETLLECDYIVIEKQMSFNHDLTRQMQNIETAIMFITKDKGSRPILVEIDSQTKSRVFDKCKKEYSKPASKSIKNRQTKEKAIDAALVILEEEDDEFSLDVISTSKKKDDLCDVCCYEYIWRKYIDTVDTLPIRFV